jgi:hypothetical protein
LQSTGDNRKYQRKGGSLRKEQKYITRRLIMSTYCCFIKQLLPATRILKHSHGETNNPLDEEEEVAMGFSFAEGSGPVGRHKLNPG